MTPSSDPNLVEFLINDQNAECVLEVLKHGEAIRSKLTERFWSELRTHLSTTAPMAYSNNFKWNLGSDATKKRESYAWLDAQFAQFANHPQSLFYRVEYSVWPQGLQLYYGLHWKAENRPAVGVHLAEPFQVLRQQLKADEYDLSEPEWWYGWRFIDKHSSIEDFLSFFVKNPKSVFQRISDDLWPFVECTINHVEKVNASLAGR
jgi:hypothetical protein